VHDRRPVYDQTQAEIVWSKLLALYGKALIQAGLILAGCGGEAASTSSARTDLKFVLPFSG
jgi:hypothetical protein